MKQPSIQKQQKSYKIWIITVLVLLLIVGGVYAYFAYQDYQTTLSQAQQVIDRNDKLEAVYSVLSDEASHCENFIARGQGDFGQFAYCEELVKWFEQNKIK